MSSANDDETVFNGGFFIVKSPRRTPKQKTPSKSRKSLLTSVLTTEAKRASLTNSPALTTLQLSQTMKSVGKDFKDLV